MSIFNKHFWKLTAGFIVIIVLSLIVLLGFTLGRHYQEKQKIETLIKESRGNLEK